MRQRRIGDVEDTVVLDGDTDASDPATPTGGDSGGTGVIESSELGAGSSVGRYVILERLGQGGMGVVFRAYDPKLRREVALKVMRRGKALGPKAQTRMLREAQALARLSDPNVVALYDAEVTEHGVCIAMEYIEGRTLRVWLGEVSREWWEVVDVVVAAARGLAAAHAADLVHRDVKPDNVLVGNDGRVRLTDFGLAQGREGARSSTGSRDSETEHDDGWDPCGTSQLTELGTVLGTPAYMAPEQRRKGNTDARSDQYALCVVLWEALYGERPALAGNRPPPASKGSRGSQRLTSNVPEWVPAALRRGLAINPEERWPSVEALVHALSSGNDRARRRRVALTLGLLGCVAMGGLGWWQWDRTTRIAACERNGESIAEVWNDRTRASLRAALVDTGVSHAGQTADKVMPWLDAQARAWQAARTDACLDAELHGTWDAEVLDRSLWCLDERRMQLEATVTQLSRGGAKSLDRAVQLAAGLGDVEPCRSSELLMRLPSPPKERRQEVRDVHAELSRASALHGTGAQEDALMVAREALSRAEALEWPPLVAKAHLLLGIVLAFAGDYAESEASLEAAYFAAAHAGAPDVVAEAAERLVFTVGYRLARHEAGLRWSRHAAVALESLPDVAEIRSASHHSYRGTIYWATGNYEKAKTHYERALALEEHALGSDHPSIALDLANLASVHWALGSYDEAKELHARALAIQERVLGPEHPEVGGSLSNLGGVYYSTGEYEEARALYERALAIEENTHDAEHPEMASILTNLANVEYASGAYSDAKVLYERALEISEKALGPAHPDVATSLGHLGNIHRVMGAYDEAKALHERALAINDRALGSEHPDVAGSLDDLAHVYRMMGDHDRAKSLHERALVIWEQTVGVEHRSVATSLVGLAEISLAQQRPHDAIGLANRALKVREAADSPPEEVADARFVLARSLWESDREHIRAIELAKQAQEGFRRAGSGNASERAAVDAWLAEHEG